MANLKLPKIFGEGALRKFWSPSRRVEIDWSNRLAKKGLRFCVTTNMGAVVELVERRPVTPASGAVPGASEIGQVLNLQAAGANYSVSLPGITGASTIFYRFKGSSADVSTSGLGSWDTGFILGMDDGDRIDYFFDGSSTNKVEATGQSVNDGEWHSLAATFDPSVEAALFLDGSQAANKVTSIPASQNLGATLKIGNRGDGQFPFDGHINLILIFDSVLSDEDIYQLDRDPSQVLRFVDSPLVFIASGISGSATMQADTAAASGAATRIVLGAATSQAAAASTVGQGFVGTVGQSASQASTATISGAATRTITASATIGSSTATTSGEANVIKTVLGDATAQASASTTSGLAHVNPAIVLTERGVGEVIQRSGASQSVTISGSYTGAPGSIECRILDASDDTTEIVSWTTLDASPSSGTFSGQITTPQGGWYHAEVRFDNLPGIADLAVNDWGVGIVIACWGQSNIENWFTDGTGSPNALLSEYTSSWAKKSTTGTGAIGFGNKIIAAVGIPVGLIDSGVGGTQLSGGVDWGSSAPSSVYDDAVQQISAIGGAVEFVLWQQGERDAVLNVAESTYQSALETLIESRLRLDVINGSGQSALPFLIGQLGRRTDSTDEKTQPIKNALTTVADGSIDEVYLAALMYDLDLVDTVHLTPAAYTVHGERYAQAVLDILGFETYHRGPNAVSVALLDGDSTVNVTITHSGGSDFTPTSGITGFEVFDDGSPVAISSAIRFSATVIQLALAAPVTGDLSVRYAYGANPIVTGAVIDNSMQALPLIESPSIPVSLGSSASRRHRRMVNLQVRRRRIERLRGGR